MEPLKFDPTKERIAESFEVSAERSEEMDRQHQLAWHEIITPTKEFREKGLNAAEGLRKFGSIAQSPEELLLAGFAFGRKVGSLDCGATGFLTTILSKLKGE